LDQIKSHISSPTTEEPSDSHTQILKLMIPSKSILPPEPSLNGLNSKLVMFASPPQETTSEESELLLIEKDIWVVSISFTFKMKEVFNSPPESATSSLLARARSHGSHYQKETVSIYHQLKLNTKLKRKIRRRKTTEKLLRTSEII